MNIFRLLPFARSLPIPLPRGLPASGSLLPMLVAAGVGVFAARPDLIQRLSHDPKNVGAYILFGVAVLGFLGAVTRSFGAFVQLAFWGALVVFFGKGIVSVQELSAMLPSLNQAERAPASEAQRASLTEDSPGEFVNFDDLDNSRRAAQASASRTTTTGDSPTAAQPYATDPQLADMFRRFDGDRSALSGLPSTTTPFGRPAAERRGTSNNGASLGAMLGRLPDQLIDNTDSALPDSAYFPPQRKSNVFDLGMKR